MIPLQINPMENGLAAGGARLVGEYFPTMKQPQQQPQPSLITLNSRRTTDRAGKPRKLRTVKRSLT